MLCKVRWDDRIGIGTVHFYGPNSREMEWQPYNAHPDPHQYSIKCEGNLTHTCTYRGIPYHASHTNITSSALGTTQTIFWTRCLKNYLVWLSDQILNIKKCSTWIRLTLSTLVITCSHPLTIASWASFPDVASTASTHIFIVNAGRTFCK